MENKFLWLCAFIDVLETLYVGIYQIGSFPLIFLHSYFWGLDVFSLWWIFSIEFKPFVNLWRWNRVYVTKWWEHSQNPQTHCNLRAPRLSQPWAGCVSSTPQPPRRRLTSHNQMSQHSAQKLILDMQSNVNKARLLVCFFFLMIL